MANKFMLNITTGNASFGDNEWEERAELSRILREVADRINNGDDIGMFRNIKDIDGNIVGTFALKDENYK